MENPYIKKTRNQKNSFLKAIFFLTNYELALTIPPGLKMSQKGSFEGADSWKN